MAQLLYATDPRSLLESLLTLSMLRTRCCCDACAVYRLPGTPTALLYTCTRHGFSLRSLISHQSCVRAPVSVIIPAMLATVVICRNCLIWQPLQLLWELFGVCRLGLSWLDCCCVLSRLLGGKVGQVWGLLGGSLANQVGASRSISLQIGSACCCSISRQAFRLQLVTRQETEWMQG